MNPVEGKIVIDVSRKYVSIYRCDGEGRIVDEDHFGYPFRIDRSDALSEVVDIYAVLYDWLNLEINGTARDGDPPAKTK